MKVWTKAFATTVKDKIAKYRSRLFERREEIREEIIESTPHSHFVAPIAPPPPVAPPAKSSRQVLRAHLRNQFFMRMGWNQSHGTGDGAIPYRRERRKLARAYAVGRLRQMRGMTDARQEA
jgi:hypothetical protein